MIRDRFYHMLAPVSLGKSLTCWRFESCFRALLGWGLIFLINMVCRHRPRSFEVVVWVRMWSDAPHYHGLLVRIWRKRLFSVGLKRTLQDKICLRSWGALRQPAAICSDDPSLKLITLNFCHVWFYFKAKSMGTAVKTCCRSTLFWNCMYL